MGQDALTKNISEKIGTLYFMPADFTIQGFHKKKTQNFKMFLKIFFLLVDSNIYIIILKLFIF